MKQFPDKLFLRALSPDELRAMGSDRAQYEVVQRFRYLSDVFGETIVEPGFVTDFASIPGFALAYIDDDSPGILLPSIVHDAEYSRRIRTRLEADQILREAMQVCGARKDQVAVVFTAVRLFGGSHWNQKAA